MVKGLKGKLYGGAAEGTWSVQLEEIEGRLYLPLIRGRGGSDTDLFSVVTSDRAPRNGLKLSAPSLTEFKKCLRNTVRHI